ncbi:SCP2 sterol-binding domain-containing protein [Plantactinospora sp. GCM10030261]|uniref:SCP2 sterol-binding domain-containing protein n=1 Tax=Plantactinospora sp. GCM10030261 TaxID=3273420 RepID=UPI00361A0846
MTEMVAAFFERLPRRHDVLPENVSATIRFDVSMHEGQTDHWYVRMRRGEVRVSRSVQPADCVIQGDAAVFDGLRRGGSLLAALFRNDLSVSGDMRVFALLRQVLPGPPDARDPRELVRGPG